MKVPLKRAITGSLAAVGSMAAAALAVSAARFAPPVEEPRNPEPVDVDIDDVVDHLSQLVCCKTVSFLDHNLEDDAEFEKLVALLPELYPHVFGACTLTRMEGRALLFKWQGRESNSPTVLMAHYDVVPANAETWDHDPFCGEVFDGALWGRGTLDTKVTFNGALYAANTLIQQGFVPQHDVYFAFSGGEEVHGPGAPTIVDWFEEQGIEPELVLDEGGGVASGFIPGIERPFGMIGIAEKGFMDVCFEATSNGGHASAPKPHSPIAVLAQAVNSIEAHPMPMRLSDPVRELLDTVGCHTSLVPRAIIANLDLFSPVIDLFTRTQGGNPNAVVRTTIAFTQMEGSPAHNVIPPIASVVANIRVIPGDSIDGVLAYLKKTINDDRVSIRLLEGNEPSRVSITDCEGYRRIARAVADTWTDCIVTPGLMMARSDSRHYGRISDRVYRFSAYDITREEMSTIHGNNERIRLDALRRSVEFFTRLLKQC